MGIHLFSNHMTTPFLNTQVTRWGKKCKDTQVCFPMEKTTKILASVHYKWLLLHAVSLRLYFCYFCADSQSRLTHLHSIGWATLAVWEAIKNYNLRFCCTKEQNELLQNKIIQEIIIFLVQTQLTYKYYYGNPKFNSARIPTHNVHIMGSTFFVPDRLALTTEPSRIFFLFYTQQK